MSGEALAAILGAVAGGAMTGGFALLQGHIDWQRKEGTRWDEVRRQAYASFLHAAQALAYQGHLAPIAFHARLNRGEAETAYEALHDLKEAETEMWRWYREIEIIGGEQVLQAANKVANRVRDIASAEGSMIGSPTEETLSRDAAVHADVGAAFATFTARVREEIGVVPPARA